MVRTRDIPHLPFAVAIHEIGLVDAAVLPFLAGPESGLRLILPLLSIPFNEADRVGSPKVLGGTCVVNALHPGFLVRVPALHIRRAVPPTVTNRSQVAFATCAD